MVTDGSAVVVVVVVVVAVVAAVVDVVAVEIEAEPEAQSDTHDGMDAEASPPHPTSSYHPGGGLIGNYVCVDIC